MAFARYEAYNENDIEELNRVIKEKMEGDTMKKGNVERFDAICARMTELYEKKDPVYGSSFHKSFQKYGIVASCIRIGDKFNRLEMLSNSGAFAVNGESIVDTLIDLANYAVMTIMELEPEEREFKPVLEDLGGD